MELRSRSSNRKISLDYAHVLFLKPRHFPGWSQMWRLRRWEGRGVWAVRQKKRTQVGLAFSTHEGRGCDTQLHWSWEQWSMRASKKLRTSISCREQVDPDLQMLKCAVPSGPGFQPQETQSRAEQVAHPQRRHKIDGCGCEQLGKWQLQPLQTSISKECPHLQWAFDLVSILSPLGFLTKLAMGLITCFLSLLYWGAQMGPQSPYLF